MGRVSVHLRVDASIHVFPEGEIVKEEVEIESCERVVEIFQPSLFETFHYLVWTFCPVEGGFWAALS